MERNVEREKIDLLAVGFSRARGEGKSEVWGQLLMMSEGVGGC